MYLEEHDCCKLCLSVCSNFMNMQMQCFPSMLMCFLFSWTNSSRDLLNCWIFSSGPWVATYCAICAMHINEWILMSAVQWPRDHMRLIYRNGSVSFVVVRLLTSGWSRVTRSQGDHPPGKPLISWHFPEPDFSKKKPGKNQWMICQFGAFDSSQNWDLHLADLCLQATWNILRIFQIVKLMYT